jgi:hypothetical protein
MTKNRIIIAGALLILGILIAMPLLKPANGPIVPENKQAVQETVPQAGVFELPPDSARDTREPVMTETATTVTVSEMPSKKTPRKARHIEEDPQDKGYDSIDPGLVPNPPKSPSPEILRNMQKKGIVLY